MTHLRERPKRIARASRGGARRAAIWALACGVLGTVPIATAQSLHLTSNTGASSYTACTTITADTSFTVTGSNPVSFTAGTSIVLGPGFTATAGNRTAPTFLASIVSMPPDFTLSVSGATTAIAGGPATYTVTVSPVNCFSGAVSFASAGLPSGTTASFYPSTVTGAGSTTMTVTTAAGGATGNFPISVVGTSGLLVHGASTSLSIQDFTIGVSPTQQTVPYGGTVSETISATGIGGFNGAVLLSFSVANSGGQTGSLQQGVTPGSVSPGSPATFTATARASSGYFTVTVSGLVGGVNHQAYFQVFLSSPTPDFTIDAVPAAQTVTPPGSLNYTVSTQAVGSNSGTVGSFTVSGLPAGASASFNPASVSAGSFTTMTVTAPAGTAAGTYALSIGGFDATAGTSHTAATSLIVGETTTNATITALAVTAPATPVLTVDGTAATCSPQNSTCSQEFPWNSLTQHMLSSPSSQAGTSGRAYQYADSVLNNVSLAPQDYEVEAGGSCPWTCHGGNCSAQLPPLAGPAPVISPNGITGTLQAGGTSTITISGSNFGNVPGALGFCAGGVSPCQVIPLDGTPNTVTLNTWTDTGLPNGAFIEATITLPDTVQETTWGVYVRSTGWILGSAAANPSTGQVPVALAPTISNVSFSGSPVAGTTDTITITGSNFGSSGFVEACPTGGSNGSCVQLPQPPTWGSPMQIGWNIPTLSAGITYCLAVATQFSGGTVASICGFAFLVQAAPPPPTLQILMGGTDISCTILANCTAQTVLAGQWMSLTANVANANGGTPTFQWTVPSATTVVSWVPTSTGNWSSAPNGADLVSPSALKTYNLAPLSGATTPPGFAWMLPTSGTPAQVSVTANLNGTPLGPVYATFNVNPPTGLGGTSGFAPPQVTKNCIGWTGVNAMCLGGGPPNIFQYAETNSCGKSATCYWVQTINQNPGAPFAIERYSSGGQPPCEVKPPAGLDGGGPQPSAGLPGVANDSPSVSVVGLSEATASEYFSTYLMAQPCPNGASSCGSSNNIFVPVSVVSWSWGGDAVLSGSSWPVNNPNPGNSNSNPQLAAATAYPTWTQPVYAAQQPCTNFPTVASLTITPSTAQVGASPTISVTLTSPAPSLGGAVVTMSSSDTGVFWVPATCLVPGGQTVGACQGSAVSASTSPVTVTANYNISSQTATVTVVSQ